MDERSLATGHPKSNVSGATPGTSHFTVYPAIDLRGGRVVRLSQGDPARQTVYDDDPQAIAERWKAAGAEWLHVVNLDGAFGDGSQANVRSLPDIVRAGLPVQFGGGLRDEAAVQQAFDFGVARVVLGTAAVENPALVDWSVRAFGPERVAVGVDARDGRVRVRGWAEASAVMAIYPGRRLREQDVAWCVFTDIARDGVGGGVNLESTVELARQTGLRVIASGGAASAADVYRVRDAGLAGVIIGRALYEGQISLSSLVASLQLPTSSF